MRVSVERENIEWMQVTDIRGEVLGTVECQPEWNEEGSFVRLQRHHGAASGAVIVRAKVANRIVSRVLILE